MSVFRACYKCNDRKVGCHAICDKYQKESEERSKFVEDQYRERKLKADLRIPGMRYKQRPVNSRKDNYKI